VRAPSGAPPSIACIVVTTLEGIPLQWEHPAADEDGGFSYPGLPPGEWLAYAICDDVQGEPVPIAIRAGEETAVQLELP